jgi:hypothetical protein
VGIDVFFTGLMLICLDGQPGCQVDNYQNTAWVIKATNGGMPCGFETQFDTTLILQFDEDDFSISSNSLVCDEATPKNCTIPEGIDCGSKPYDLYVNVDRAPAPAYQRIDTQWLPQIDDIDSRFGLADPDASSYIPIRLRFQTGVIQAGAKWPPASAKAGNPRKWFRSNGVARGSLPSELSDRLRVNYENANVLSLICLGKPLIVLTRQKNTGSVTIKNFANVLKHEEVGGFDDLGYLLWYYILGSWPSMGGKCPPYKADGSGAIVLRCAQETQNQRCSYYDNGAAGTRFWPPMLKPKR